MHVCTMRTQNCFYDGNAQDLCGHTFYYKYVKLPDDETGQHFGAYVDSRLVSVISVFFDAGDARFRKFATDTTWQGKGIGTALLRCTIEEAKKAGARTIWCDARSSALPFYQRFGMEAEGEIFHKGGQPYLVMRRTL
ncbi:hypothetical protein TruAng_009017 [Truncatella angustata]|nr:hypothetical protein TruAng_009017 [Truncatella angustata]